MTARQHFRPRARLAAVPVLLLLLAACGQGSPAVTAEPDAPPASDEADPPAAEEGLVLEVTHTGGFATPVMLASRLPLISVYADGRVITEGPQILIYPGPALPNLLVRQVEPEGVEELVELALEAGVGQELDLGQPPIADATSTRFTVVTESGREQLEVYALSEATAGMLPPPEEVPPAPGEDVRPAPGEDGLVPLPEGAPPVDGEPVRDAALPELPDMGLTPEQEEARAELLDLLDALTNLPATLGEEAVGPEQPYVPDAVAALVMPYQDPGAEGIDQEPMPWPGPPLPGEPLLPGTDASCVTATGEEAEALLEAASDANTATPWTADGERWSVTFRPLLPHESGCEDLLER